MFLDAIDIFINVNGKSAINNSNQIPQNSIPKIPSQNSENSTNKAKFSFESSPRAFLLPEILGSYDI